MTDATDRFKPRQNRAVVGMTSNGFTLADPNARGMLDVVGFDMSVPAVIADFVANSEWSRTPRPGHNAGGSESLRLHFQFLSRWPSSSGGGLQFGGNLYMKTKL